MFIGINTASEAGGLDDNEHPYRENKRYLMRIRITRDDFNGDSKLWLMP